MKDFINKLESREWNWEDREILVQGDLRILEQQFFKSIRFAKDAYIQSGVRKDDRVLLLIPAGAQLYVTIFALWCIGASAVLFDSDMTLPTRKLCMERAKVKHIICTESTAKLFDKLPEWKESVIFCEGCVQFEQDGTVVSIVDVRPEREALVSFTSGSTGIPKGIVRTFGFLERQREAVRKWFLYEKEDADFAIMPVFTITNFVFGVKTVLPNSSFREPKNIVSILKQLKKEQVNRMILSPFLAEEMVQYGGEEIFNMPCVKKVFLGGGPCYKHLIKEVRMLFPNAEFYLLYGCSEAEPIALYNVDQITPSQFDDMDLGKGLLGGNVCLPCAVIKNQPAINYGNCK